MRDQTLELRDKISALVAAKAPFKAFKVIRWRLRGLNGEFVGLHGPFCAFVTEADAIVFDGRDNEDMKRQCYETNLKQPLVIEVLA